MFLAMFFFFSRLLFGQVFPEVVVHKILLTTTSVFNIRFCAMFVSFVAELMAQLFMSAIR
jgi:hypothetical protein